MNIISMKYPYKENSNVFDGEYHSIVPSALYSFYYYGDKYYLLSFMEGFFKKRTILTSDEYGNFYNRPVTDNDVLARVINRNNLKKERTSQIRKTIELGETINCKEVFGIEYAINGADLFFRARNEEERTYEVLNYGELGLFINNKDYLNLRQYIGRKKLYMNYGYPISRKEINEIDSKSKFPRYKSIIRDMTLLKTEEQKRVDEQLKEIHEEAKMESKRIMPKTPVSVILIKNYIDDYRKFISKEELKKDGEYYTFDSNGNMDDHIMYEILLPVLDFNNIKRDLMGDNYSDYEIVTMNGNYFIKVPLNIWNEYIKKDKAIVNYIFKTNSFYDNSVCFDREDIYRFNNTCFIGKNTWNLISLLKPEINGTPHKTVTNYDGYEYVLQREYETLELKRELSVSGALNLIIYDALDVDQATCRTMDVKKIVDQELDNYFKFKDSLEYRKIIYNGTELVDEDEISIRLR